MTKISRMAFESAIRAKMLKSNEIASLEVIEDKDCIECDLCGYLIPEPKNFNGKQLCEQCYLGETNH